jgi:hypothetical protein
VKARLAYAAAGTTVAVAVAVSVLDYTSGDSLVHAAKTFAGAALAVAVAGLGLSLPGISRRGAVIGGLFLAAGLLTWTFTDRPIVIWAVLALTGVVFAVWAFRPPRGWRALPRLGTAWLGLAYWPLGVVSALLVGHAGVAAQRLAYAGVFTLAALATVATVRRRSTDRPDPSTGIAAAIIVALAALLLTGAGTLFDSLHAVPNHDPSTEAMRDRFWGGPGLFFHPNAMAGLAVLAAARIGPDRAFALWQRLAVTGMAGFVLYLTNSRVGFVFAVSAAVLHAAVLWRPRHPDLPVYRRRWLAAVVPFAVLTLVLVLSGGKGFLLRERFASADVTTGRVDTWRQVADDWRRAGLAEKLFGDARTARAVVIRDNDGAAAGTRRKLNTDNAAVGALRRGGVLGAAAFLLGLVLLVLHALLRRESSATWFQVAALGALPTIATEDWLLGGTGGVLWILLLAGEARVLPPATAPANRRPAVAAGVAMLLAIPAALVPATTPAPRLAAGVTRTQVGLNDGWRFLRADRPDAQAVALDDTAWTPVTLPHTWNALDGQDGGADYDRGYFLPRQRMRSTFIRERLENWPSDCQFHWYADSAPATALQALFALISSTSVSRLSTLYCASGAEQSTRCASPPDIETQSPSFATLMALAGSVSLSPIHTLLSSLNAARCAPATSLQSALRGLSLSTLYSALASPHATIRNGDSLSSLVSRRQSPSLARFRLSLSFAQSR